MQAHMVSFFKEQIFVFHAISELFPSEITSSNLMQNMPGCHCRNLVKPGELAGPTDLQNQCSFTQYNASQVQARQPPTSMGCLLRGSGSLILCVGATPNPNPGSMKREGACATLPLPLEREKRDISVCETGTPLPQTLVRKG